MKLKLREFRCHADREFNLPDSGLVLLTGPSGSGKTTILNALAYALYGKVGRGAVYAHGRKTARVELRGYRPPGGDQTLDLVRTAPGARLKVRVRNGGAYEDGAAQGVVDAVTSMDYGRFVLSSYVVQRADSSILSLPPREQLVFVKALAAVDDYAGSYRSRIKEKLRLCEQKASHYAGELAVTTRQLEELGDAAPAAGGAPPPDGGPQTDQAFRDQIAAADAAVRAGRSAVARLRAAYDAAVAHSEREKTAAEAKARVELLEKQLREAAAQLAGGAAAAAAQLAELRMVAAYRIRRERLDELVASHRATQQRRVKQLETKIVADAARAALAETVAEFRAKCDHEERVAQEVADAKAALDTVAAAAKARYGAAFKKKSAKGFLDDQARQAAARLEKERAALEDNVKRAAVLGLRSQTFACPECSAELVLGDGGLARAPPAGDDAEAPSLDAVESAIAAGKESIAALERDLATLAAWTETLSSVAGVAKQKCLTAAKLGQLRKKVDAGAATLAASAAASAERAALAADPFPADYAPREREVEGMLTDELRAKYAETAREELDRRVAEGEQASREHAAVARIEAELAQARAAFAEQAAPAEEAPPGHSTPAEAAATLRAEEARLDSLAAAARVVRDGYDRWLEWRRREERAARQRSLEAAHARAAQGAEQVREKETGWRSLAELCQKADVVATEATLDAINQNAAFYLDRMFDEPISVRLSRCRRTKKGDRRLVLTTELTYKGTEYGSLAQLSGGERQRCNLAFVLAVNDFVGSPLLFLDECVNSLDGETNTEILTFLKEACPAKLILVVAHEAVPGLFDEVVEV